MKHKKTIISIAFLLLMLGGLNAQETLTTTGGESTGVGGTASYSIGQVVFTTNIGSTGSEAQGVQQPYEISTTVGINETAVNLEINIYPNPTANNLTLKVEDFQLSTLNYVLIDIHGKIIENKTVKASSTTIKMEGLSKATYFLQVMNKNQSVKTFKIIKN